MYAVLLLCDRRNICGVAACEQFLEKAREAEHTMAKRVSELQKVRNRVGFARARIIAQQKAEEAARERDQKRGAAGAVQRPESAAMERKDAAPAPVVQPRPVVLSSSAENVATDPAAPVKSVAQARRENRARAQQATAAAS